VSSVGAAVAAYGLPTRLRVPEQPLSDPEFAEVLTESEQARTLGLLGEAVRDGAFAVTDEQRGDLEQCLQQWCAHALRVERMALDALEMLAVARIDCRVLKGVALAHTAYPRPEPRLFGDVDLLVPGDRIAAAVELLTEALGAKRAQPELRPGFDERFGKEVLLRRGVLELDVHRIFVDGAFGLTIRLDDLFAPPYRFALAGYELEALPMPQRLLHAAYTAALGDWPPRAMSLRDVAQIIAFERPNLVDVLLMARAWRCEAVLARAIVATWDELGLLERPPLVAWAERQSPSRLDRLLLAAHEGPGRAFSRHLAAVLVLATSRDRLAYLHAILLPQRAYLQARSLSAWSHARRACRRLFGRGRARWSG